jgi:hypothetical protein
MDWLPIETAPRDGSSIIVGYDYAGRWIVHVAFWDDKFPTAGDDECGWSSYITNSITDVLLDGPRAPTHWLPLPTTPTEIALREMLAN